MFGKVKTVDFHTSFSRRVAKTFPKHLLTAEYYSDVSNKRAKTVPLHFHFSAQHGLIRYLHGTVAKIFENFQTFATF